MDRAVSLPPAQAWVLGILRARLRSQDAPPPPASLSVCEEAIAYIIKQRVALLLYDFVKRRPDCAPEFCLVELKRLHRDGTIHGIRLEGELLALHKIFGAAGLPFMPLKGMVLSHFLYQDPVLRPCVDIDLLVPGGELARAAALLHARGYRFLAHGNPWRQRFRRRVSNHWELFHPERRIMLELHHQLLSRSCSSELGTAGLWPRAQTVLVESREFRFMSPEDLLLYLAVHSAKENWASLLQVYDMAALIIDHPHLDWTAVLARAEEWHSLRRLMISCVLAAEIFEVPLADPVRVAAISSGRLQPFVEAALRRLLAPDPLPPISRWQEAWNDLGLAERWRDRLTILFYKGLNQLAGLTALLPEGQEAASGQESTN